MNRDTIALAIYRETHPLTWTEGTTLDTLPPHIAAMHRRAAIAAIALIAPVTTFPARIAVVTESLRTMRLQREAAARDGHRLPPLNDPPPPQLP